MGPCVLLLTLLAGCSLLFTPIESEIGSDGAVADGVISDAEGASLDAGNPCDNGNENTVDHQHPQLGCCYQEVKIEFLGVALVSSMARYEE
jgi:hypothetical protein